jgi:hypothetical protein
VRATSPPDFMPLLGNRFCNTRMGLALPCMRGGCSDAQASRKRALGKDPWGSNAARAKPASQLQTTNYQLLRQQTHNRQRGFCGAPRAEPRRSGAYDRAGLAPGPQSPFMRCTPGPQATPLSATCFCSAPGARPLASGARHFLKRSTSPPSLLRPNAPAQVWLGIRVAPALTNRGLRQKERGTRVAACATSRQAGLSRLRAVGGGELANAAAALPSDPPPTHPARGACRQGDQKRSTAF